VVRATTSCAPTYSSASYSSCVPLHRSQHYAYCRVIFDNRYDALRQISRTCSALLRGFIRSPYRSRRHFPTGLIMFQPMTEAAAYMVLRRLTRKVVIRHRSARSTVALFLRSQVSSSPRASIQRELSSNQSHPSHVTTANGTPAAPRRLQCRMGVHPAG
jgi:hypothetical protein